MLWHIVRFELPHDVDDTERSALAADLRGLADAIDEVAFVRVAEQAVGEPHVLGLIVGFANEAALLAYQQHPAHAPVARRIDALAERVVRLDMVTDDRPDALG